MSARSTPSRGLLVLASTLLLGSALAGCFDDADAAVLTGADLPTLDVQLGLAQVMFHPSPDVMLSAWTFHEIGTDPLTYEPLVIRAKEGQRVSITLYNTHNFNHTIHWHGLHVPWEMDGVPYMTQDPILPGEEFTYEFVATPAGTHMFHCHVDTPHHVDMGMSGMFIVEPMHEPYEYDSENIMLLDDWDSTHLHQNNNAPGDAEQAEMTADSATDPSGDPFSQLDRTESQAQDLYNSPENTAAKDAYTTAGGNPARRDRDWYPETYAPWTPNYDMFTINGKSFPTTKDVDPMLIKSGETKRVRMANIGNSEFSMHLHGHGFLVTHKDGYPLPEPYMADTLPISPGERYDIMIEGTNPGQWMFHDHNGMHAMNQNIYPGGAGTMLAYTDHYAFDGEGHSDHEHGGEAHTGRFLGLYR